MANAGVTGVEITPSDPEQGDTVRIEIQADPGEDVSVSLTYSGDAPVSGGEYEIGLSNIVIPQTPNGFSASVSGVSNMNIKVKLPLLGWVTLTKPASGGVASTL